MVKQMCKKRHIQVADAHVTASVQKQSFKMTPRYLSMDVRADKDSTRVGPRNSNVLIPPSRHYNCHVETHDEGERNQFSGLLAIFGNLLKQPAPKSGMLRI